MSIFLATILAISANPSDSSPGINTPVAQSAAPAEKQAAAPVPARAGKELSKAAHAAMKQWAKATDDEAEAAAKELFGIYKEILQDTGMGRSERETLRLMVRSRLDRLCTQISKKLAKDKAADKAGLAAKSVPTIKHDPKNAVLAGVGMPAGGGAGGAAAGQNAASADHGQDLVDLIQTTICPKSWDINGGAGSIYYWKQQHAIVVRATGDVHDDIADALEQLNRAGH